LYYDWTDEVLPLISDEGEEEEEEDTWRSVDRAGTHDSDLDQLLATDAGCSTNMSDKFISNLLNPPITTTTSTNTTNSSIPQYTKTAKKTFFSWLKTRNSAAKGQRLDGVPSNAAASNGVAKDDDDDGEELPRDSSVFLFCCL